MWYLIFWYLDESKPLFLRTLCTVRISSVNNFLGCDWNKSQLHLTTVYHSNTFECWYRVATHVTTRVYIVLVRHLAIACLFDSTSDWDLHCNQRLWNEVRPTNFSSTDFISFWTAEVINFTADCHCSADGHQVLTSAHISTHTCTHAHIVSINAHTHNIIMILKPCYVYTTCTHVIVIHIIICIQAFSVCLCRKSVFQWVVGPEGAPAIHWTHNFPP